MTTLFLSQVNSLGFRDAALFYAAQDIPVFPLQPGANAPPLVQFTTQATTDPEIIKAWWDLWPDANVGLRMGGQWHALDLDQKDGRDGWASYLAVGGPALPAWPVQKTPSGGLHLLWRGSFEGFSNFTRRGPHGGMDMRTRNGYIAASPSVVNGVRYHWLDGDPDAGIPAPLLSFCQDASAQAAERSQEAFPMVGAAEVSEAQAKQMVTLLGADHARFLLEGVGTSGDDSRDAYHACLRAFSTGWTLADMAAIGPATYLAYFGGKTPHNAPDPWAWCWRYTVRAAWLDWRKRAPGGRVGGGEGESPGARSPLLGGKHERLEDTPAEDAAQPQDVYRLLEARIARLPLGDYPAAETLLAEIHASGMPESRCQALLVRIKEEAGHSLTVLRQGWREVQERARQAREERAAQRRDQAHGVWVRDQGKVLDRNTLALISRDSFLTVASRQHDGDRQAAEMVWLQGPEALCEQVETITYDPGLAPGVVTREGYGRVYNLYTPSRRRARGSGRPEDVAPWLYLLDSMGWEEGDQAREWLLDRFAWMVQRPGVKVNHGVVIGGAKGIGKDSMLAPVIEAVGRQNVKTIDGAELLSDFNDYLAQTKLLVCNEIDFGTHRDRRTVAEKLKRVLAAPPDTLRVNAKNVRPYEIPNVVSFCGHDESPDLYAHGRGRAALPAFVGGGREASGAHPRVAAMVYPLLAVARRRGGS